MAERDVAVLVGVFLDPGQYKIPRSPVPSSLQRSVAMRSGLADFLVVNSPPAVGENLVRKVALAALLLPSLNII